MPKTSSRTALSVAQQPSGRPWQVVALCALVVVAEGYDLIVYGALLPKLLAEPDWGLTSATAGTIGSQAYVGMLVGALGGGPVSDRFGRRRLVIGAVAWFTAWTFACALMTQPWELGVCRLLAGLGMGAVIPAVVALAKEHAPPARTGVVVTILMAGVPVGGTAASLLGLAVLPGHGWRPMFVIGGAVSAAILALSVALLPESGAFRTGTDSASGAGALAAPSGVLSRFAELFRHRRAVLTTLFALASFANLLTWYGLNTWLTTLMRELDYPLTSALQFSLTLNTGAVAGSFALAWLATRAGNRQVALLCTLLTAGGVLALAVRPGPRCCCSQSSPWSVPVRTPR
jgi:AAHS family benzoate transporter-like MFS transporter